MLRYSAVSGSRMVLSAAGVTLAVLILAGSRGLCYGRATKHDAVEVPPG